MSQVVFALTATQSQAIRVVSELKQAGFLEDDLSVLLPDKTGTRDFAHEQHTKMPEGTATGGVVGGLAGAFAGVLAGIGAIAIPGLGPFIAAGPILAALGGATVGGVVGGVAGALVGLGIPEIEAKAYEGKIRDGNILISAHCVDADHVKRAKDVLQRCGATNIVAGSEKSPPKAERRPSNETPRW